MPQKSDEYMNMWSYLDIWDMSLSPFGQGNKFILLCFTCYFALSIITMFIGIHIFPSPLTWFCRLPTALFIISLVSGIEGKKRSIG